MRRPRGPPLSHAGALPVRRSPPDPPPPPQADEEPCHSQAPEGNLKVAGRGDTDAQVRSGRGGREGGREAEGLMPAPQGRGGAPEPAHVPVLCGADPLPAG